MFSVNILICGWYGTETLGDRAILAGIFKILRNALMGGNVKIASLYPFLTKRTIIEDSNIYSNIAPELNVSYFEINNKITLNQEIESTDLVIFGGGPIMDLPELQIMKYIFVNAKNRGKKTAIVGCGLGPLYRKQYKNTARDILRYSDLTIFRDKNSVDTAMELLKDNHLQLYYSHDPAILASYHYRLNEYKAQNSTTNNYIAVNIREFQNIGFRSDEYLGENKIIELMEIISKQYETVKLVPMHTFGIGGDDRYYLTKLKYQTQSKNIEVIHEPMNLFELFDVYSNAAACIGMRYHSIVFQTLLNGNNYILDYTDKKNGKIGSFIKLFDTQNFYGDRYINVLQDISSEKIMDIRTVLARNQHFNFDDSIYKETLDQYVKLLKKVFI